MISVSFFDLITLNKAYGFILYAIYRYLIVRVYDVNLKVDFQYDISSYFFVLFFQGIELIYNITIVPEFVCLYSQLKRRTKKKSELYSIRNYDLSEGNLIYNN